MKIHEFYIKRCLELAKNGIGNTYPNPSVGCVIVHKDQIIGEGFTSRAGGPHAEVNAINSVREKSLLREATLYVTLEPCSHFGKTPPCSDLIVEMGIPRVVIGTVDSNEKVSGRGITKLAAHGCEVIVGVLDEACRESNKRFFCFHERQRPYIILKWAQTADGYIAPPAEGRASSKPAPVWISDKPSRQLVHKWRSEEQAILVGTATAMSDNPSLTTRDWKGAHPLRIFTDRKAMLPAGHNLTDGSTPTLVFTAEPGAYIERKVRDLEIIELENKLTLPEQLTEELHRRNIQSVIVEGGSETLNSFITSGLWDEARVFCSPVTFGQGIKAPSIDLQATQVENIGKDLLHIYRNPEYKTEPN